MATAQFLLLFTLLSIANAADPCREPLRVATKFVELEGNGELGRSSTKIEGLISYESGDLPAWDASEVVKKSKVESCKIEGDKALITVTYQTIGDLSTGGKNGGMIFVPRRPMAVSTQILELGKVSNTWKIFGKSVGGIHEDRQTAVRRLRKTLSAKGISAAIRSDNAQALHAIQTYR